MTDVVFMKSALAVLLVVIICGGSGVTSAADSERPCSSPGCSQFDFWIGEWNLTWTSKDGKPETGENRVSKILGGCVIREEFSRGKGEFTGMSVSAFSPGTQQWKQTWVDNGGGYLDFVGEFTHNRMVLQRKANREGKEFLQRMQWYNITTNTLDWNWERSDDNGTTWVLLWRIHYERKS